MSDNQAMMDLLDSSLDDLADLPEFKVFPNGAHICTIKFESKDVNGHPSIECTLTGISTEELANPADTPIAAGDVSSVLFMMDNEFGQGALKAVMKPLAAHFGTSKISETIEAAKGAECLVVTKQRQNKEKTQTYLSIASITVM